eukprot:6674844-Pyramimonas_sp.AAC.1
MQWLAPLQKLKLRARLLGSGAAPASINGVLYSSRVFSVVSYVAQFVPLPQRHAALELGILAQVFRAPLGMLTSA